MPGDTKVKCVTCGKECELLVSQEMIELIHKGLMVFVCGDHDVSSLLD